MIVVVQRVNSARSDRVCMATESDGCGVRYNCLKGRAVRGSISGQNVLVSRTVRLGQAGFPSWNIGNKIFMLTGFGSGGFETTSRR